MHDGDWFSIEDGKSDGHSMVIEWASFRPSDNTIVRRGEIWNAAGGGTKRWKNKDLTENYTLVFRVCPGDHIDGGHKVNYPLCSDYVETKS